MFADMYLRFGPGASKAVGPACGACHPGDRRSWAILSCDRPSSPLSMRRSGIGISRRAGIHAPATHEATALHGLADTVFA